MKRAAVLLAVAALTAAPLTVLAAEPFSAALTPEAEVPAVTGTDASGDASVTISDDGTEVSYEVSYEDLTGPAQAAHIHFGSASDAGPVLLPLEVGDSPFSGTITEADFAAVENGPQTFDEALDAIRDGMTYINVHTEANPGGEIRGQLEALPDTAAGVASTTSMLSLGSILFALLGGAVLTITLRRAWVRAKV
jgi:hypothetical protein